VSGTRSWSKGRKGAGPNGQIKEASETKGARLILAATGGTRERGELTVEFRHPDRQTSRDRKTESKRIEEGSGGGRRNRNRRREKVFANAGRSPTLSQRKKKKIQSENFRAEKAKREDKQQSTRRESSRKEKTKGKIQALEEDPTREAPNNAPWRRTLLTEGRKRARRKSQPRSTI